MLQNTYDEVIARDQGRTITWAPAALVAADKVSFQGCGFVSLQDTLTDARGRHYFDSCYIEGAIDFIWSNGQSFFKVTQLTLYIFILYYIASFMYIYIYIY